MVSFSILVLLCAITHLTWAHHHEDDEFRPSKDIARRRSPDIFNAIHNAMRQWGSSVHHNGMSIFLATVSEGVLLHHGNDQPQTPSEPDWLAYEIEHAEGFARGHKTQRRPPGDRKPAPSQMFGDSLNRQNVMGSKMQPAHSEGGWLHVYRTTRPLQFLYVDGMSGGKTTMGTLDTQDYLLRGDRSYGEAGRIRAQAGGGPMNERQRAIDLCGLCKEWGLHGIIRMEAGFEIIQCNFTDGLEQIQALQRPDPGSRDGDQWRSIQNFEYLRGVAARYFDIGSSRTIIDYSSMVSAFFFPVNLTNPDETRPDLPRLSNTTDGELAAIKEYLKAIVESRKAKSARSVNWQGISDMIVSRYADRLDYMVNFITSVDSMAAEVSFLVDLFIDYSSTDESVSDAISRCTNFYLHGLTLESEPDHLVLEAFKGVNAEICTTLFEVRELLTPLLQTRGSSLQAAIEKLQSLMKFLGWARFKQCSGCGVDEVCIIPMWPFGAEEDYFHPRCSNSSDERGGKNYWGGFRPPGAGKGAQSTAILTV